MILVILVVAVFGVQVWLGCRHFTSKSFNMCDLNATAMYTIISELYWNTYDQDFLHQQCVVLIGYILVSRIACGL